jgi:hypothetical protein
MIDARQPHNNSIENAIRSVDRGCKNCSLARAERARLSTRAATSSFAQNTLKIESQGFNFQGVSTSKHFSLQQIKALHQ